MTTSQEENRPVATSANRKARWLPLLEQELKSRVGWADEAVSPFARSSRSTKAKPTVRRAA